VLQCRLEIDRMVFYCGMHSHVISAVSKRYSETQPTYALHSIYGSSIYLLSALWSSVTNLLLHLGRGSHDESAPRIKDYILTVNAQTSERDFVSASSEERMHVFTKTTFKGEAEGGEQKPDVHPYRELRKYLNESEYV
ncbi:hypothetical protein ALC62_11615, partial [Cyphomyrmex costatus]